jgi:triacylglycerol esterase/lipase EstA (alpha/beta hydrolase family)
MMPRYYLKFLGGATRVHRLIGLAPSNHGTTLNGILTLARAIPGATQFLGALCPACTEQTAGSQFLQNLNAGGDTVAGVLYTVIETRYDEVVTPYTSAFLSGSSVTNIRLQDRCFLDFVGHIAIITDANVFQYVKNALDPAHATPVFCVPFPPSL